ncbi:MAG TPA: hypothetical protein EYP18_04535 [Desulfobacterales bacterium]|nr:hypothetical protein [Desulfobacterales bacterium]
MGCGKDDIFKVVFNTDGEFLHVEGANGDIAEEVTTVEEINKKEYDICGKGEELASIKDLMVLKKKDVTLQLLDVPGHSVCFINCYGRLIRLWC